MHHSKRLLLATAIIWLSVSGVAKSDDAPTLMTYKALTPEAALEVAQASLKACRDGNYQITVAVVDRGGSVQALLRDRFAGPHTPQTAIGKARTALSFRTNTTEMVELTLPDKEAAGIRHLSGVVIVGGGIMVRAAGALVGAIGVSGAPSGTIDEMCAQKGLDAIQERLDF